MLTLQRGGVQLTLRVLMCPLAVLHLLALLIISKLYTTWYKDKPPPFKFHDNHGRTHMSSVNHSQTKYEDSKSKSFGLKASNFQPPEDVLVTLLSFESCWLTRELICSFDSFFHLFLLSFSFLQSRTGNF